MTTKQIVLSVAMCLSFPAVILAAEYWDRRGELCYWQGWRDLVCTLGGAVLRLLGGCALLWLALEIARDVWRHLPSGDY